VLAVLCSVALAQLPKPQPLDFNWRDLKNIWQSPRLEPALQRFRSRLSMRDLDSHDLQRIVGGNEARVSQFPFSVLTVIDNMWWCGGSIINANYVLTAAHCIYLSSTASMYTIISLDEGYYWTSTSSRLVVHEHYDDYNLINDIGLMRSATPAPNNIYTNYINLPRQYAGNNFAGYNATIQGFGVYSDERGEVSEVKRYVEQTIMVNNQCYWYPLESEMCTDTTGGRGPCNGDSGGGLFVGDTDNHSSDRFVVGIVSFGALAGCELDYPAVYTRVTYYLSWIDTHAV